MTMLHEVRAEKIRIPWPDTGKIHLFMNQSNRDLVSLLPAKQLYDIKSAPGPPIMVLDIPARFLCSRIILLFTSGMLSDQGAGNWVDKVEEQLGRAWFVTNTA